MIDEFTYDSHLQYLHRIFRATTEIISENSVENVAIIPSPVGSALKQNYPEVINSTRFIGMGNGTTIKHNENLYKEEMVYKADSNVFQIFSFRMLKGNPREVLAAPQRVVPTESIAEKYFGMEEPQRF